MKSDGKIFCIVVLVCVLLLQLDKLKRSYLKLQRKQLKETSGGVNTKETDLSEVTRLSEKIEVQH